MKSSKKILFISPQPFFTERGSPLRIHCTLSALSALGYEVDLLAFPFGDDIKIRGMRIFRGARPFNIRNVPIGPSWRKLALDGSLSLAARKLANENDYALIHGVEEAALIACYLAKRKGIPYFVDMHSLLPEHLAQSGFLKSKILLNFLVKRFDACLRGAGGVMTVADELTEYVARIAPQIPVSTIEDLPLDTIGTADERLVERLRSELGLTGTPEQKVVLYTGNFKPYQGIDLLLHSFAKLKEMGALGPSNKEAVLLIAGGNCEEEVTLYKGLARDLNLGDSVIFTGSRPASEMSSFMSLGDILVSPRTLGGNTPLKIYSYMAANRLIVATRISSHTQVLDDNSALLVEPRPAEFAQALAAAIRPTREQRKDFAARIARAKELTESRFTKRNFELCIGTLYRNLIGPGAVDVEQESTDEEVIERAVTQV